MKILIVDDERICREMFKRFLSRYGHCEDVKNGTEAIEAYKASLDSVCPYQLIILDIILPDLHGGQVLKVIREIEEQKGIDEIDKVRVIFASASHTWFNNELITKKLNPLYENYYIKSPDLNELVDKIHELGFIID